MTNNADTDPLLTLDQTAERWQVSPRTVMRLIKDRKIKSVKIGKQIRLRLSDIIKYENR